MILVFVEHHNGKFKKATLEAMTYGRKTANILGTSCSALVLGTCSDVSQLADYGADRIFHHSDAQLDQFDDTQYAEVIANVATQHDTKMVVMSFSSTGKNLAGRLSVKLQAACVSAVNALPRIEGDRIYLSRGVFSGKAIAEYKVETDQAIVSIMANSIPVEATSAAGEVIAVNVPLPEKKVVITDEKRTEGTVPLPEAERVVSAGRGMKGPENWGIIEELADVLGATTACSRPVADTGWRPHHEHVGQTGIAIRPNLYIAIGISGAIQHLAGVNNSKTIVVINKDPEAPFFKAADYGVCADLFEVVPRLTESLKKFKNQ